MKSEYLYAVETIEIRLDIECYTLERIWALLHPQAFKIINLNYLLDLIICTAYFSLSFLIFDFHIFVLISSNVNNAQ